MLSDFTYRPGHTGVADPFAEEPENTEDRSLGRAALDTLGSAAAVPVGWLRAGTNQLRSAAENYVGGPEPITGTVDKAVAAAQQYLQEGMQSGRSKQISQNKWDPGPDDRSAWREPVTTLVHQGAGLLPYLALGAATGGAGPASLAAMGAIGFGDADAKVRDFADNTSRQELNKVPAFVSLMREFSGDEQAARVALYHRSTDLISELTNAGANMLNFGVLTHAMAGMSPLKRPIADVVKRAVGGTAEGALMGGTTSAAGAFGEQRMKVNAGIQQAIDTGPIIKQAIEGAAGMAPLIGGLHVARGARRAGAIDTDSDLKPKNGVDPGVADTIDQQINEDNAPTPPPLAGANAPPGPTTAAGAPKGVPATGAGVWNQALPGAGPGGPPPGGGGAGGPPPVQAAPPAGQAPPGQAINAGAPPIQQAPTQPVQPRVQVTPPAGRTAPVTPAPTGAPPVEQGPPAGTPIEQTVTAMAPPPTPIGTKTAIWMGETVTISPRPARVMPDGEVMQEVILPDGARKQVPTHQLEPVTPEVTQAAAPAGTAAPAPPVSGERAEVTAAAPAPVEGGMAKVKEVQAKKAAPAAAAVPKTPVETPGETPGETPVAPAPPPVVAPTAAAPAAPAAPAPVPVGKQRAALAAQRKQARTDVIKITSALQQERQSLPQTDETRRVLTELVNPRADMDTLQAAADWGRDNDRPDVVTLASHRANMLAAQAKRQKSPYPEGHREHTSSTARLASRADELARRAREVAEGIPKKVTSSPDTESKELKATVSETAGAAPTEVAPEAAAEPKETAAVDVEGKPAAPAAPASLKARTLQRDDVVTTEKGRTYTVHRVTHRDEYPQDPLVQIKYPDIKDTVFEHRASELDKNQPAKSIERAEQGALTTKNRPRERPEGLLVDTAEEQPAEGRTPPRDYPSYKFIGHNAQGHELWQSPATGLRVSRRMEKGPDGKVHPFVRVEDSTIAREEGERGRYVRSDDFRLPTEDKLQVPPVVERVFKLGREHETTRRQERPREAAVRAKTAELEALDTKITETLRDAADKATAAALFDQKPAPTGGIPRSTTKLSAREQQFANDVQAFEKNPSQGKWIALNARAKTLDRARAASRLKPLMSDMLEEAVRSAEGLTRGVTPRRRRVGESPYDEREQALLKDINQLRRDTVVPTTVTQISTTGGAGRLSSVVISDRQSRISTDEFNARRKLLLERARVVDRLRKDANLDTPFEDLIPAERMPPSNRTETQQFADAVRSLEQFRNYPTNSFLIHPGVQQLLGLIRSINASRGRFKNYFLLEQARRRTGEAPESLSQLPIPAWLEDKLRRSPQVNEYRSLIDSEAQAAYRAARELSNAHVKAYYAHAFPNRKFGLKTLAEQAHDKLKLLNEAEREALRKLTDVEMKPVELTEALRKKIAEKLDLEGRSEDLGHFLSEAKKLIEAEQGDAVQSSKMSALRKHYTIEREGRIDYSIAKTIESHFSDADGIFQTKKWNNFLNDLMGMSQTHEVTVKRMNPITHEVEDHTIEVSHSMTYPEPPPEMAKGPALPRNEWEWQVTRGADGAPISRRVVKKGGGVATDEAVRKWNDIAAAHYQRVADWSLGVERQFEATMQLRKLLQGTIARIEVELKKYTTENRIEGETIKWRLPNGTPTKSGYLRFRAGKSEENFDHYNFANDMQKVLNHIEVDMKALENATNFKGDMSGWDISKTPFQQYARKLSPLLQDYAFGMRNYQSGNMRAIRDARDARTAETDRAIAGRDTMVRDAEGKWAALDPDQVADLTSTEDALIDAIALRQTNETNQRILRDEQRKSNRTLADERAEGAEETAKTYPLNRASAENLRKAQKYRPGTFDEEGLPVEGKRNVEFEPYIEDQVDEAYRILDSADPTHPMIDEPLTPQQVVDKVKQILRDGVDTGDMSHAITPKFLDRLAKTVEGTTIVRAPYEVVSAAGTDSPGYYVAKHDRVVLPNDAADRFFGRNAVHELVHAAGHGMLNTDPAFRADMESLLKRARDYAKTAGIVPHDYEFEYAFSAEKGAVPWTRQTYGLRDVGEMLSEMKSSQAFRQFLARVPSGDKPTIGEKIRNVLNAAYRSIRDGFRRLMGNEVDGDTALDTLFYDQSSVLGKVERMYSRAERSIERYGRVTAANSLTLPARPGARSTFDRDMGSNLRRYAGKTVNEAIDRARHISQNKAVGLSLHTSYDLERRTSDQEFKDHVHNVNSLRAREAQERNRLMNEIDGPVVANLATFMRSRSPKWRDKLASFLIDETMHRAYADAPLNERDAKGKLIGKNSHIDPNDIAWRQTVREHSYMQDRYKEVSSVPGFQKIRNEVHQFYKGKEHEIRRMYIRTFAEMGLMPDIKDPKLWADTLNALEKHITTGDKAKGTMTPGELKAMDQFDLDSEKFREKVNDIRKVVRQYSHIEGPFVPLVRDGEFAVSGKFHLPAAKGGEVLMQKDRRSDEMVDNGIRTFKDLKDLHAYERKVTEELGIKQIDGGEIYFDPKTNERVMRYTPEELAAENVKRTAEGKPELDNRRATKGDIKEMKEQGRAIETRYWIEFSPHLLEKHASRTAARESVAAWRTKLNDKQLTINNPERARRGEAHHSEQYFSDTLMKIMNSFKASEPYQNLDTHEQMGLNEKLRFLAQKAVMHRGVSQRYLPRRYVLGASNDLVRSLSDYSGATASWLSRMKFAPEMTEAWRKLNEYVDANRSDAGDKNSEARSTIRDYIGHQLHRQSEPMVDNGWSRFVDRLIRWTMLDKLPGISYFVQNGTEVPLVAGPLMMGRHNPLMVAARIREAAGLFGPLKMIGGGIADMASAAMGRPTNRKYREQFEKQILGHRYAPGLMDLIKYMSDHGMYDQHAGLEYQQMARDAESGIGAPIDKFSRFLTNIFQSGNSAVENFNRITTSASAYMLERDRLGRDPEAHQKALRYAWDISNKANGMYFNWNTPEMFNKSPLHRLAFEFKKYPQRIMANYIEAAVGAINGDKEKARQLAAMLITQGFAAGLLGLPTEVFSVPLNALNLAGLVNYNWEDARADFRSWSASQFGAEAGEYIAYGALRASGADIGGRLSQSDMVFFGSPRSNKAQDIRSAAFGIMTGAGGGVVMDLVTAAQKGAESYHAYQSGNPTLGFKLAQESAKLSIPFRALTDLIDTGIQSSEGGMQQPSGQRKGEPLSSTEAIWRAAGFTPRRVANEQETARTVRRMTTRYNDQKKQFTNEFASGNGLEQQRVWARVQEWNATLPDELKVDYGQLVRASAAHDKAAQTPTSKVGVPVDKRSKAFMSMIPVYQ